MREAVNEVAARPNRLWLAYASALFGLGVTAQLTFLVPLRARELGASFDGIGLIMGAGSFAAVFTAVPSGALIDRLGAKRTFMIGAGSTGAISLLFPLVTNYWWFLALQPLVGATHNLAWTASQSHITGIGSRSQGPTLTGRFSFVGSVGAMVGPVMCGTAAGLVGFRWALLLPVIYSLGCMVVGIFLAEPVRSRRPRQGAGIRSAWRLLSVAGLQVVILLTFTRLWTSTVYATFMPVYLVDHGFEPGLVGTVTATTGFAAAAAAPTAGILTRRWTPLTVSFVALFCASGALVLAPHALAVPWLFLVPAIVGAGAGLSWPLLLTIVTSEAPEDRRGVALGLRSMAAQAGMTAAPVSVGRVVTLLGAATGFAAAGGGAAGLLLGAALLARRIDRRAAAVKSDASPWP
jgi:MFS family permease